MVRDPIHRRTLGGGLPLTAQLAAQFGGIATDYKTTTDGPWRIIHDIDCSALDAQDLTGGDGLHTLSDGSPLYLYDSATLHDAQVVNGAGIELERRATGISRWGLRVDDDADVERRLLFVQEVVFTGGQNNDRVFLTACETYASPYSNSLESVTQYTGGTNYDALAQMYNGGWTTPAGVTIGSAHGLSYQHALSLRHDTARIYQRQASGEVTDLSALTELKQYPRGCGIYPG